MAIGEQFQHRSSLAGTGFQFVERIRACRVNGNRRKDFRMFFCEIQNVGVGNIHPRCRKGRAGSRVRKIIRKKDDLVDLRSMNPGKDFLKIE